MNEFTSEAEVVETESVAESDIAAFDDDWDDIDLEGLEDDDISDDGDGESEADQQSEEAADEPAKETATEEKEQETDQFFELKHLGEVKKVSKEEALSLAQKGMDYDRVKQKWEEAKNERPRFENYERFLNELAEQSGQSVDDMIEAARASMILAKAKAEGKEISADEALIRAKQAARLSAPEEAAEEPPAEQPEEAKQQAQRQASFQRFREVYPDVKPEDIPQSVWTDYGDGKGDLADLFTLHENKQLKQELEALKQNEKNRARTTGSRKSAGNKLADKLDEDWYDGT